MKNIEELFILIQKNPWTTFFVFLMIITLIRTITGQ